jgi:hypothetical protein
MAKYSRAEIEALSNRLEARAASTMFPDQPNLKADILGRVDIHRIKTMELAIATNAA